MTIWNIKLQDGTEFVGKRKWFEWYETYFERTYTVLDSPTIPVGSTIIVPNRASLFRIKVKN